LLFAGLESGNGLNGRFGRVDFTETFDEKAVCQLHPADSIIILSFYHQRDGHIFTQIDIPARKGDSHERMLIDDGIQMIFNRLFVGIAVPVFNTDGIDILPCQPESGFDVISGYFEFPFSTNVKIHFSGDDRFIHLAGELDGRPFQRADVTDILLQIEG